MCKRIFSASVSVGKEIPFAELRFRPGINILWGADVEDVVLTLAGIFGGMPPLNGNAEVQWDADTALFVSVKDGSCGVDGAIPQGESIAQTVKAFHKQRFLNFNNRTHILDGSALPAGFWGAGDLLSEKLREMLAREDDCPLFVFNFLERLDEAVRLRPIFEALNAAGRQAFIAVPHYYEIKALEEIPYVTVIPTL